MKQIMVKPQNGYSIAELLLVFGIIAGVLIGVWAMYAMLSSESDTQTAIADIQLLRNAANEFKHATGQDNKYTHATLDALKPYLGDGRLTNDRNIFGSRISVTPRDTDQNLELKYPGVPTSDICQKILERFGEVTRTESLGMVGDIEVTLTVESGKTISGYVGGNIECEEAYGNDAPYLLTIIID